MPSHVRREPKRAVRDIWRGVRMPKREIILDEVAWIFSCPCCEYEMSYFSEEAARTGRLMHCRSAGADHDSMIVDQHFEETFCG
jgi:phage-related protein